MLPKVTALFAKQSIGVNGRMEKLGRDEKRRGERQRKRGEKLEKWFYGGL